ncbi:hypothetical protein H4R34_004312 [Dimargaris verticillata]|uniref:WD40-repeat-containing domain protein n=1 Tax=Dimargaris verticillata TaxID=2761393 RepID=A0A9W8ECC4_9FUNG|nr:hypothetical protein H4R34_004312 [Dimargaris verticillata]
MSQAPSRSAKRTVTYVIGHRPSPQKVPAHLLGVNALALDPAAPCLDESRDAVGDGGTPAYSSSPTPQGKGVLYSAGRDGMTIAWDLHLPSTRRRLGRRRSSGKPPHPGATFHNASQHHADWVNAIALCADKRIVATASSDRTVKLWRPYASSETDAHPAYVSTLGYHADYVKALTYAPQARWLASGGLDQKIHIWDLNSHHQLPTTTLSRPQGATSIYTLAANPSGTVLVSGSPEKVVRVWDPRSGQAVTSLTGHTDNIRTVLVSQDGDLILSGSSDTTIKLWSLTAGRCIATYTYHTDSIWALYSDHPRLHHFYSGGKDGLIAKTLTNGVTYSEHQSMAAKHANPGLSDSETEGTLGAPTLVAMDAPRGLTARVRFNSRPHYGTDATFTLAAPSVAPPTESESIAIARESKGIVSLVAHDSAFIWTATNSSDIKRWRDIRYNQPQSADIWSGPADTDPPAADPSPSASTRLYDTASNSPQRPPQLQHGRNSRQLTLAPPPATDAAGLTNSPPSPVPPAALLSGSLPVKYHQKPAPPSHRPSDPSTPSALVDSTAANIRATDMPPSAAALAAYRIQSTTPLPLSQHIPSSTLTSDTPEASTMAASIPAAADDGDDNSEEEFPSLESETTVVRLHPDYVIPGDCGLVRSVVLNNKFQVLALNTAEEVSLWDLIRCRRLKVLGPLRELVQRRDSSSGYQEPSGPFMLPSHTLTPNARDSPADAKSVHFVEKPKEPTAAELWETCVDQFNTDDVVPSWCVVDTKIGALSVHLDINRCFDAEQYADLLLESVMKYDKDDSDGSAQSPPFLPSTDLHNFNRIFTDFNAPVKASGIYHHQHHHQPPVPPDQRINLGRWVLRYLFEGYTDSRLALGGVQDALRRPFNARVSFPVTNPSTTHIHDTKAIDSVRGGTAAAQRPSLTPATPSHAAVPSSTESSESSSTNPRSEESTTNQDDGRVSTNNNKTSSNGGKPLDTSEPDASTKSTDELDSPGSSNGAKAGRNKSLSLSRRARPNSIRLPHVNPPTLDVPDSDQGLALHEKSDSTKSPRLRSPLAFVQRLPLGGPKDLSPSKLSKKKAKEKRKSMVQSSTSLDSVTNNTDPNHTATTTSSTDDGSTEEIQQRLQQFMRTPGQTFTALDKSTKAPTDRTSEDSSTLVDREAVLPQPPTASSIFSQSTPSISASPSGSSTKLMSKIRHFSVRRLRTHSNASDNSTSPHTPPSVDTMPSLPPGIPFDASKPTPLPAVKAEDEASNPSRRMSAEAATPPKPGGSGYATIQPVTPKPAPTPNTPIPPPVLAKPTASAAQAKCTGTSDTAATTNTTHPGQLPLVSPSHHSDSTFCSQPQQVKRVQSPEASPMVKYQVPTSQKHTEDYNMLYPHNECPPLRLPLETTVLVFEESANTGALFPLYRNRIGKYMQTKRQVYEARHRASRRQSAVTGEKESGSKTSTLNSHGPASPGSEALSHPEPPSATATALSSLAPGSNAHANSSRGPRSADISRPGQSLATLPSPSQPSSLSLMNITLPVDAVRSLEYFETLAPPWLLEFLLCNRAPLKDPIKLSFVMKPHPGSTVRTASNHRGKPQAGQKSTTHNANTTNALAGVNHGNTKASASTPSSTIRLVANRMLRVRKVIAYAVEKLDLLPPPGSHLWALQEHARKTSPALLGISALSHPFNLPDTPAPRDLPPELWLEVSCGDQVLSVTSTLASIKQHVWKSSQDIVLQYRYRPVPTYAESK